MWDRPPDYYDRLVEEGIASGNAETHKRSHVVRVRSSDEDEEQNDVIRVGNILSLVSEGISGGQTRAQMRLPAAFLAVMDFNGRRSTFIDNLQELTADCNFFLSIRFKDPRYSPLRSGQFFQEDYLFDRDHFNGDTQTTNVTHTVNRTDAKRVRAISILGPSRSVESALIAAFAGSIPDEKSHEDRGEDARRHISLDGIPNISPTSSSADLENRMQYPFLARTTPTDNLDAVALVGYLKTIGVRRIAVLHVNDGGYGRAYMLSLRSAAAIHDIRLHVVSYYDGVDESLKGAIDSLGEANYTYHMLIPAGGEENWKPVVHELFDASLIGVAHKFWFLAGALLDVRNGDLGDPRLAQALNRSAIVHLSEPRKQAEELDARLAQFIEDEELLKYFLSKQLRGPLSEYNFTQYRARYKYPEASDGKVLTTYDAVMALGIAACNTPEEFFLGPNLYESLKGVKFQGASGEISFDNVTATRQFANITITNIIVEPNGTRTDGVESTFINTENGDIEIRNPLIFADGSTTPPQSLEPVVEDKNLLSTGQQAVCWVLASIVLLLAAGCAIWTAVNRRKPIVKASQPVFLYILAVGSFILGCSIVPRAFQEPMSIRTLNAGCMLEVWSISIGFSTGFGSLFAKTWRIHRVFKESRRGRRIQVRVKDVLKPVFVLLTANVVLLATWTVVAPVKWLRMATETDSYGRITSSIGRCEYYLAGADAAEITFASLILAVNFVALGLANWMTYQARNLPSQFNDNPYVGITNMVILEVSFIGGPILFLTTNDPASSALVTSFLVGLISTAMLFPIILPFTLKRQSNGNRRLRVGFLAGKKFQPDKALCGFGHYPAANDDSEIYGASRVRVSGLPMGTPTGSRATQRGSLKPPSTVSNISYNRRATVH